MKRGEVIVELVQEAREIVVPGNSWGVREKHIAAVFVLFLFFFKYQKHSTTWAHLLLGNNWKERENESLSRSMDFLKGWKIEWWIQIDFMYLAKRLQT